MTSTVAQQLEFTSVDTCVGARLYPRNREFQKEVLYFNTYNCPGMLFTLRY
jgi:hypothetical protein